MKKILIDLKELVSGLVGVKETVAIKNNVPSPDEKKVKVKSSISGKIEFTNLEKEILAEFNLKISIRLTCFRCAENFKKDVFLKNKNTYKLSELTEDQKLDILPEIFEEIILSIPAKPLCKEGCNGLCPSCGQNLNIKKCNCKTTIKTDKNKTPQSFDKTPQSLDLSSVALAKEDKTPRSFDKPFANLKKLLERKENG